MSEDYKMFGDLSSVLIIIPKLGCECNVSKWFSTDGDVRKEVFCFPAMDFFCLFVYLVLRTLCILW